MLRRPPRATRTDTLFPYNDALPILQSRMLEVVMAGDGGPAPVVVQRAVQFEPVQQVGVEGVRRRQAAGGQGPDLSCRVDHRSEEHTSELQSLMRISYAVFCLKKKNQNDRKTVKKSTIYILKQ